MAKIKSAVGYLNHCFSALLAVVAVAAGSAHGGEGKPVQPPPAPDTPKEADKRAIEEKAFTFESRERRDPFTFVAKVEIPADPITTPNSGDVTTHNIDPLLIQQKKAEAEAAYAEAEKTFLDVGRDGKAAEVMAKCDVGLKVFRDIPNLASVRELQEVRERLADLRKAAERFRARQDAEKKFRDMHIQLSGVVARERRSQAIINGRTVSKGEVVSASDNYAIVVDEITADRVVVVSPEGFKMMLTFQESTK